MEIGFKYVFYWNIKKKTVLIYVNPPVLEIPIDHQTPSSILK